MIVEQILNNEQKPLLHMTDVSGSNLACRIELTVKEAEAILHSLCRTMCKGEQLTISMELEDRLVDVLKNYR